MTELRARQPASATTLRTPIWQFLSFVLVGAAGTLLHYLALTTLVLLASMSPGAASAVGACLGAVVNYWLNHRFTFASTRPHREMMPRFFAVAAVGALANGLIVSKLAALGMHFLLAQVIATCVILIANFLISKKWIFLKPK